MTIQKNAHRPALAVKLLQFYNDTSWYTLPSTMTSNPLQPDNGWLARFGWEQALGNSSLPQTDVDRALYCPQYGGLK
jgi:hypothetical protein